jgi:sugar phosphate isomerase/epimerase
METAFGNRGLVESVELAKKSGFQGVQIHTGKLDKNGTLTLADKALQQQFRDASAKHQVEIISLCAGSMNRLNVWKEGPDRKKALAIMTQSIEACGALDCEVLLYPFFGPSNFQKGEEKIAGVTKFIQEILPLARKHGVTLGIESPITCDRVLELFKRLGNPDDVKMFYDTGNMMRAGEDIYATLKKLGNEAICEIHLKPEGNVHFGKGKTDLAKLAATLDQIGYQKWLTFEARGGVINGDTKLSVENLKGMKKLTSLRKE